MAVHCPNCSEPITSEPIRCPRCGYRSEMAPEYFWLYIGGGLLIVGGLAVGALGVALQGCGPGHWSAELRGWFPLGPFPSSHHWLAFLVAGIVLSVAGMGLTRHRPGAWALLLALLSWETVWTALKLFSGAPGEPHPLLAGGLLTLEVAGFLLAARLGQALRRTPARDVGKLQRGIIEGKTPPTAV